jgi:prepilin-type N-terminal cleavage/methylation domain-containing protein
MKRGKGVGDAGKGFTLIELLVVVSIIALLVSILLPSLGRARQHAQMVVCLTNLKQIGNGIQIYAGDSGGILPGPVHPAMYRDLKEAYPDSHAQRDFWRGRMLTWLLRNTFKDSSAGGKGNISDKVATCPVLLQIVPDSHFKAWREANPGNAVYPTHYVINTYDSDTQETGSPFNLKPLGTKPPCYFGWSYASASPSDRWRDKPPQQLGAIRNASAEWAVADAWFRWKENSVSRIRMTAPYQFQWSGEALPHFAPHMRKRASNMVPLDKTQRERLYRQVEATESDGLTCTAFFDGHSATVRSRSIMVGNNKVFYGFPGTRNWNRGQDFVPPVLEPLLPPPM